MKAAIVEQTMVDIDLDSLIIKKEKGQLACEAQIWMDGKLLGNCRRLMLDLDAEHSDAIIQLELIL